MLGRPILALLLAVVASGIAILRQPATVRPNLVVWSFAETHVAAMRGALLDQFRARTGITAGVSLMGQMGENIRLSSAFMSGSAGPAVPDLCEIEIHSMGQFLRPPVDDIGLLPLNEYLRQSGWDNRMIASRFAPWSKVDPRTGRRLIYGVPEDVHPVTITFRKDLFDEAKIDPRQAKTWGQFQDMCLAFENYWANHGRPDRRALGLSTNSSDDLVEMLLQRRVNLIDSSNRLHLMDAKVLETVIFYAELVAGPRAVAAEPSPGVEWTEDFARGDICAVCTADWKVDYLRQFTPELAGKVMMMPLPRFEPGDAPTSTLGGTMVGICRTCPHPDEAWKLLEFLFLSPEAHRAAIAEGDDILPAIPGYWIDPAYHKSNPFFYGGQSIGELYVSLAPEIPERIVTPYSYQAELALAVVLRRAVEYVGARGDAVGLNDACAGWLAEAQDDIQRRIEFGKFEP